MINYATKCLKITLKIFKTRDKISKQIQVEGAISPLESFEGGGDLSLSGRNPAGKHIREVESIFSFKRLLKSWLFGEAFEGR
jgi:hypothetical protein